MFQKQKRYFFCDYLSHVFPEELPIEFVKMVTDNELKVATLNKEDSFIFKYTLEKLL